MRISDWSSDVCSSDLPLLLLVIAHGATSAARTRLATVSLTVALLALSTAGLVDQQLNGTNPRLYDFRGAVAEIEPTAQPGDVLAYAPDYLACVLGYYAPDLVGMPVYEVDPEAIDGERSEEHTSELQSLMR